MPPARPPARPPSTGDGRVAKNTVWNLLSQFLALPMALVAIPVLIAELGTDKFGILTMAWVAIGYFSLFDLGLGQALTQMLAKRSENDGEQELPALIWTALGMMGAFGLLALLLLTALTEGLVTQVLEVPAELESDAIASFRWIAASLPFVMLTAGLAGILAARRRFDLLGGARVFVAAVTYIGPILVLPFSNSLAAVTSVLVVGRVAACAVHFGLCLRTVPEMRSRFLFRAAFARRLLRFGGWVTVSGVFGPLMVTADRFLVGAMISMAAVAYYSTPYELITKLWTVPGAVSGVLFVAFAASAGRGDTARDSLLFTRGMKCLLVLLFPIVVTIVAFAHPGLQLWLGTAFADRSFRVLQWLAVGVFINSLAQIPFVLLQGKARPDLPAKFHLIELPFYLVAVFALIGEWGVEGAAMAWVARATLDALLLFSAAWKLLGTDTAAIRRSFTVLGSCVALLAACALASSTGGKVALTAGILAAFGPAVWLSLFSPDERAIVRHWLVHVAARKRPS